MKRIALLFVSFMFVLFVGCSQNANVTEVSSEPVNTAQDQSNAEAAQSDNSTSNSEQKPEVSATDNAPKGEMTTTKCVALPDNFAHAETVYITATGDTVTHIQITTGVDTNSDVQMQSYKHWTPIYEAGYSDVNGVAFSADEAAGTWTIDADISEESLSALAENYADFSLFKKGGNLSKDLLIQYYQALQYTCEEN